MWGKACKLDSQVSMNQMGRESGDELATFVLASPPLCCPHVRVGGNCKRGTSDSPLLGEPGVQLT